MTVGLAVGLAVEFMGGLPVGLMQAAVLPTALLPPSHAGAHSLTTPLTTPSSSMGRLVCGEQAGPQRQYFVYTPPIAHQPLSRPRTTLHTPSPKRGPKRAGGRRAAGASRPGNEQAIAIPGRTKVPTANPTANPAANPTANPILAHQPSHE